MPFLAAGWPAMFKKRSTISFLGRQSLLSSKITMLQFGDLSILLTEQALNPLNPHPSRPLYHVFVRLFVTSHRFLTRKLLFVSCVTIT